MDVITFEFENREGKTYTYCEDWFIQTNQVTAIQYFMVMAIVVVNMMLKKVLRIFVDLEAPESETERIVSTTQKLFVALLMNTALLSLIIQGNVQRITGGASVADDRQVDLAAWALPGETEEQAEFRRTLRVMAVRWWAWNLEQEALAWLKAHILSTMSRWIRHTRD